MSETPFAWPNLMSARLTARSQWGNGPLAMGTGFMINHQGRPTLITNRHILAGRRSDTNTLCSSFGVVPDSVEVEVLTSYELDSWKSMSLPVLDAHENPLWREHPTLGRKADIVALPFPDLEPSETPAHLFFYDLTNEGPKLRSRPGDPVQIIGFPKGRSSYGALPIWSRGYVASEPSLDFEGLPCFLIDARTKEGQSGSPVILYAAAGPTYTTDGSFGITEKDTINLIGIYSGRIQSDLDAGMVWKLDAIKSVIEDGISPSRDSVKL